MSSPPGLHRLARLHGVQVAYHDNRGRRVAASAASLMAALQALRVPLRDAADIPRLLAHRQRELWERLVEPVVVAWQGPPHGDPPAFTLRLPVRLRDRPLHAAITFEDGGLVRWTVPAGELVPVERAVVDRVAYVAVRAGLPARLPLGYHDLHVGIGESGDLARVRTLLVSAPVTAAPWKAVVGERGWGLFAPLHGLWEDTGGGPDAACAPTYRLVDELARRISRHGGSVLGTLPLMAAFLDEPYDPSPYAPVSRLFWNELYLDPPAVDVAGAARPALPATGAEAAGRAPGAPAYHGGLFDPRAAMEAKRPALEAAARWFFARDGEEPDELASFRARNPAADDYARFRALVMRLGVWRGWSDRLRGRDVRAGDYDEADARYHLYVQWLAERQLTEVKERAESSGVGLYLDLPLGVHADGYDVWRERELFATRASAGAPPDPLAAGGQDWGFPPLHPEAGRLERHRYFIACIRNHLRFARVLRVDHVMQLHRMYWVLGGEPGRGVYVRYPADELHAILCLESHRARAVIVGEDLGTVPREVRRDMRLHGLPGMYVAQFELEDAPDGTLRPRPVRPGALASVGTHDTPTFAGWWTARDVDIRDELGQLGSEEAATERAGRGEMRRKLAAGLGVDAGRGDALAAAGSVHRELLSRLARSDAGLVLVTLEDLWLEPEPQNVPGTVREENWRRQAAWPMEALGRPSIGAQLDELNEQREGSHG